MGWGRAKGQKYGAKKTTIDGIVFASKQEGRRYVFLRDRQERGEIQGLELQPKYLVQDGFRYEGKWIRPVHYIADFRYIEDGKPIVEDSKGFRTPEYKVKIKFFLAKCAIPEGFTFREV